MSPISHGSSTYAFSCKSCLCLVQASQAAFLCYDSSNMLLLPGGIASNYSTWLTLDKYLQGHFEVTDDISEFTKANFMNGIGKKTPVAVRFSTVTMERDSPESLRDVRGFSVKWYTEEGNWDLVGNNVPVSPLVPAF